ncbi:protein Svp26p [Monosporozyma unispora]|nr:erv26 super protein [Kazachstania unispora]
MILQLVSYLGTILGFIFLTLSIASGLYYISEIVEEYTEPTRRFLSKAIYAVIAIMVLLLIFDKFPVKLTIFAIVSHVIYLQNLKKFPFISLTSPIFILSCIGVLVNHYLWFQYFNKVEIPPQFRYSQNYIPERRASFAEVASFFGICIWFIPFALFVSLSAGDYVLPTTADIKKNDDATADGSNGPRLHKKTMGLARMVINRVRDYISMCLRLFGFKVKDRYSSYDGLAI